HIETDIRKRSRNDLRSAIVPILSHFGDKNSWPPALFRLEIQYHGTSFLKLLSIPSTGRIYARDGPRHCLIATPHPLERHRNLAQRRARPRCCYRKLQKVSFTR